MNESFQPRRGRRPGDVRVVVGRRQTKLPRTLGASALFSACYGNVGSSIYYALGVTAALALGLTPVAFLLAGGIFVTTALNYAEGTAALPHAGGSSSFARRAFNRPIGFLVGWIQLLNYTATVSISAYTAIAYLGIFGRYVHVFKLLQEGHWHVAAAILLTLLLILVNVIGIQESSLINLGLALLDLGTQVVLVLLGLILLLKLPVVIHNVHLGVAPTWGNFLASISIAMVSYTGIETISNMSEEAKDPGRAVPRATFAVIGAVLFVSAFLPTIGMSVFPVHPDGHGGFTTELATTWKDDPVAGIVTFFQPEALAFWSAVWVAILAFTILVIATNAGLIGISRLSYSMATNRLFPSVFSKLHPRFRTPYLSLIVFGVLAALLIVPARIDLMAAVYSLAATFAFATAHLAVMRLRYVEPDTYRPYRMPFNIPMGRSSIPVLSVLGAIAISSVFSQLIASNIQNSSLIYGGWVALGIATFIGFRRLIRQPVWEKLATPPPIPAASSTGPAQQAPPHEARVHVARLLHDQREWVRPIVEPPGGHPRFTPLQIAIGTVALIVVSAVAIAVDLSSLDPFGPGLGWSPGVVVVALAATALLMRSRAGI